MSHQSKSSPFDIRVSAVLCSALVAGLISLLALVYHGDRAAAAHVQTAATAPSASERQLEPRLDRLESLVEQQHANLSAAIAAIEARASGPRREPVHDASEPVATDGPGAAAEAPPTPSKAEQVAEWTESYLAAGDRASRDALVRKALEEGLSDQVLAFLLERSSDRPDDIEAQFELGEAYVATLRFGDANPGEAAELAQRARAAYSSALELDPNHWGARYSSALTMAFAPQATGLQAQARLELEKLRDIQSSQTPNPGHVMTFYFLGNLYYGEGKVDMAIGTWQEGLRQFPGNTKLISKLEAVCH